MKRLRAIGDKIIDFALLGLCIVGGLGIIALLFWLNRMRFII